MCVLHLLNMNKCCLNTNLKAKSTRSRWENRWESAFFVPVGGDSKEREKERAKAQGNGKEEAR